MHVIDNDKLHNISPRHEDFGEEKKSQKEYIRGVKDMKNTNNTNNNLYIKKIDIK